MDSLLLVLLISLGIMAIIVLRLLKRNRVISQKLEEAQAKCNKAQKQADRLSEKLQHAQKIMNKLHIFGNQLNDFFKEIEDHPENTKVASKKARLNFRSFMSFYEKWIPETALNQQPEEVFAQIKRDHPTLNKKELLVVMYILQGYTSKEIALLISKSVKNVEHTRTVIRRKMQIPDGESLLEYLDNG